MSLDLNIVDKRIERLIQSNNKYFKTGFSLFKTSTDNGRELKDVMVSIPNLTSLYLNISDKALETSKSIYENQLSPTLEDKGSYCEFNLENSDKFVFDLYENMIVAVVFAYTSIESLVNNLIPNHFVICQIQEKGKLHFSSKLEIEKNLKLSDKLKDIIPKMYKSDIRLNEIPFWADFKKLEKYRNGFIHTKSNVISGNTSTQVQFLTDVFFDVSKYEIVQSARKLIQYLVKEIEFVPGIPAEFVQKSVDVDKYISLYSKLNLSEAGQINLIFESEKELLKFKNDLGV